MWNFRALAYIDFRLFPILFALMTISLLIISDYSVEYHVDGGDEGFFTPMVNHQLQWFCLGSVVFVFVAAFDYNKLREWTWAFYALMLLALIGLFFTDPIQRVHRWYRLPFLHVSIQPSECAKLIVVITLSWFLERRRQQMRDWSTVFYGLTIVGIPFLLILKQPDLGTALVLFPIALVMFYFGGLHPLVVKGMTWLGGSLCA